MKKKKIKDAIKLRVYGMIFLELYKVKIGKAQ